MGAEPRRVRRAVRRLVVLLVLLGLPARTARAQDSVGDVLSFLLTNQAVVTDDFARDQAAAAATRDTVSRFLQVELATLPISAATSGFVYRLNPALGTMERASDSFGPFFLERASSAGRGQMSVGATYRLSRFDTLDGRSLRDGTLVTTANRLATEAEPFDRDTLTLKLSASTFTVFGTYGLTDRLDVGVAVPIVRLRLSGRRLNAYRGEVFQQAVGEAEVTGVADIALRAKYNLVRTREAGLAATVDVRLPTGDEAQLLGAGRAGVHLSAIASLEGRRVGAHVTAGLAKGGVSDEVTVGAAVVLAATPRFNLVGEMIGRRLSELTRITDVVAPHPTVPNVLTTRLLPETTGTTTALALVGFKWNVGRTWLLDANVAVPLTNRGLTGTPSPSIGLAYTFDRP